MKDKLALFLTAFLIVVHAVIFHVTGVLNYLGFLEGSVILLGSLSLSFAEMFIFKQIINKFNHGKYAMSMILVGRMLMTIN